MVVKHIEREACYLWELCECVCSLNTVLPLWLPLQENLQLYVQKVFSSITQSSSSCPPLMCDVFRSLRHLACRRFPGDAHRQTVQQTSRQTDRQIGRNTGRQIDMQMV